jgi:hypothetical protein
MTGAEGVDTAIGGEEAHHNGMGTEPFAHFHLLADEGKLGIAVCEMTLAGAHQHMGAQLQLLYTVGNVFGAWGDAADFETAAQFDTGSTACLGMFG